MPRFECLQAFLAAAAREVRPRRLTAVTLHLDDGSHLDVQVRGAPPDAPAADRRAACRRDVLALVVAADRPVTRKEVIAALRAAGLEYADGAVGKALAGLTREGVLVNPRDWKGYRLPPPAARPPRYRRTLFGDPAPEKDVPRCAE